MGRFEKGDRYWQFDAGQKSVSGGRITADGDQETELPAAQQIKDWRFSNWELRRVIRSQLVDGYWPTQWREELSSEPRPLPLVDAEDRLLHAADDDLLVYADQLLARGEPRGELMVVQARLSEDPDAPDLLEQQQQLLAEHGFLGPLAGVDPGYLELGWRIGFIEAARLHMTGHVEHLHLAEEVLWQLLELDDRYTLRHLRLGKIEYGDNDNRGVCALLMNAPEPPPLQTLTIGSFGGEVLDDDCGEIDISRAPLGDLSRISAQYPRLEDLELTGNYDLDLGAIQLPRLRRFAFRTGSLTQKVLSQIFAAPWPELEDLDLWFGDHDYGGDCTLTDLKPLLSGELHLPKLRRLHIRNTPFTDDLCQRLIKSPLLPRLSSLDLSFGTMTDHGALTLEMGRKAFSQLQSLDVRENALTGVGIARVKGICKVVETADNDPDFRYVSVSE